jgi:hypothetical protein
MAQRHETASTAMQTNSDPIEVTVYNTRRGAGGVLLGKRDCLELAWAEMPFAGKIALSLRGDRIGVFESFDAVRARVRELYQKGKVRL